MTPENGTPVYTTGHSIAVICQFTTLADLRSNIASLGYGETPDSHHDVNLQQLCAKTALKHLHSSTNLHHTSWVWTSCVHRRPLRTWSRSPSPHLCSDTWLCSPSPPDWRQKIYVIHQDTQKLLSLGYHGDTSILSTPTVLSEDCYTLIQCLCVHC